MHQDGEPWRCKKKKKHIFLNKITNSTVANKIVLLNPFDEITICSLFNELFIRCFKLICTAHVIDC